MTDMLGMAVELGDDIQDICIKYCLDRNLTDQETNRLIKMVLIATVQSFEMATRKKGTEDSSNECL